MKDGDVTIIGGVSGGHKTNMLLNMAYGFQTKGINVLFLTLEMDSQSMQTRCICRAMGINYEDLTERDITPEIKKKVRDYNTMAGSRIAIGSSSYRSSFTKLKNFIAMRALIRPFNILIIDQIDMIESGSEDGDPNSPNHIVRNLRILGAEYGFATVSSFSLSRKANDRFRAMNMKPPAIPGDAAVSPADIIGCSIMVAEADNIFILRPTSEDKLEVLPVKLRYASGIMPSTMKVIPQQFKVMDIDPAFEFAPVGK